MLLASDFVYQRKVHFFQSNKRAINEGKERTVGFLFDTNKSPDVE